MILITSGIIVLVVGVLSVPLSSDAQQRTKVPRIGVLLLGNRGSSGPPSLDAFRQGLHDLGYIEGKNIAIECRFAEGKPERLPDLAAELVRIKVDVIVTGGWPMALAAKQATTTIPIVMAISGDPVGTGLVRSLARPGGNITGLTMVSPELSGKRLELLKEAVPSVSRVAILWDPRIADNILDFKETQVAAEMLGLKIQPKEVRDPSDIDRVFSVAGRDRIDGLVVISGGLIGLNQKRIVELTVKNRLPAMHENLPFAVAGGLMAYGVRISDLYRRAATYVDRILKGANPADLPVERPMRFQLIINLKTAKKIGLNIPPEVLMLADRVIK